MKKGYTLVELMVVIALLGIVGVSLVSMFLSTARNGGKSGALALVKQEGDYAITTMERYIHFAKDVITTPCDGVTPLPGLVISQLDGLNVGFAISGTKIQRDGSDITSDKVNVTSLVFVCTESANKVKTVDIDFDIAVANGEAISEHFHSKVVLRNKSQ